MLQSVTLTLLLHQGLIQAQFSAIKYLSISIYVIIILHYIFEANTALITLLYLFDSFSCWQI